MADFVDTSKSIRSALSVIIAEGHPIDVLKLALTIDADLSRHTVTGSCSATLKPALFLIFVADKINEAVIIDFAFGTEPCDTAIIFFLENG